MAHISRSFIDISETRETGETREQGWVQIVHCMYTGAKAVKPLERHRFLITFENDEQRIFDVTPYLDTGIFSALKDDSL